MPSSVDEILGESQDTQKRNSLDSVLNSNPGLLDYHNSVKSQLDAHDRAIDAAVNGVRDSQTPAPTTPDQQLPIRREAAGTDLVKQYTRFGGFHLARVPTFNYYRGNDLVYSDSTRSGAAPVSQSELKSRAETKSFFNSVSPRDTRFNLLQPPGPTLKQEVMNGAQPMPAVRPSTFVLKTPPGFDYNLGTGEYIPKSQPGYINGQQVPGTASPPTYPQQQSSSAAPTPSPLKYPNQ